MKILLTLTSVFAFLGLSAFACSADKPVAPETGAALPRYSKSGYDLTPLSKEKLAEILKTLTPEQIEVTQHAGTERSGTSPLNHEKRSGLFVSAVGGLPLFRSSAKFDSGTGWPSFYEPIDPAHVILRDDSSGGMKRTEVLDARSGAHLGHVFDDGPKPTGLRYCMNGAALKFIPDGDPIPMESQPMKTETAYFAGGCFWGVEDVFEQTAGVVDAESGYMGGKVDKPTYKQVCAGNTGHAETVKVVFDPARITYKQLLKVFFDNHDPTTMNRQGPDVGDNYRSVVFAASAEQKKAADEFIAEIAKTPRFDGRKIVTQVVEPGPKFWPAEDYHQDYHKRNGGTCRVKVY
jgi:peptide methionine sulfoxide reductase msrA/msrB